MALPKNVSVNEIEKFDQISQIWWDKKGEMGTLHTINPLRLNFIRSHVSLNDLAVLDVGCGGGILTEALAQAGADATGIDLSTRSIEAARFHQLQHNLNIDYRVQSAEELADLHPSTYDVVTCMEMLEHVPKPLSVVKACAASLKPGGYAFFSSVNRTPKAWLLVIIGGEYVLRLLPRGSHQYSMLVKPDEIRGWAEASGLRYRSIASLIYNPFSGRFKVAHGVGDVNYMMAFQKVP